jgi:hypothetical protein
VKQHYEIVRFYARGPNQVIKELVGVEEEAQDEVDKYDSVPGYSFVGYRRIDKTEEEIVEEVERDLTRLRAIKSLEPSFTRHGRRRYLG